MAVTALTLYGYSQASSTLPTAQALTPTSGSPSFTAHSTPIDTTIGFGEVYAAGTTLAWPSLNGLDDPSGYGFLWDAATLDNQQILAGVWTIQCSLGTNLSSASATADLYARVYRYQGGTFTLCGTLSALGQTITPAGATYTLSGSLAPVNMPAGDRLYFDLWANIRTNNGGINLWLEMPTTAAGASLLSWATPGYQPLTQAQLLQSYMYGSFVLHDGVSYLVTAKDFEFPQVKETLFQIARFPGKKKTGEIVSERTIPVTVRVLAASRAELEQKLDALYQALNARQQPLTLHALDGRYWIADAIAGKASFQPGRIVSVEVPVSFLCAQPYALAASPSSYTYPSTALALVSGTTWQTGSIQFPGGGTVYAWPTITLTNTGSVTITSVTLTQNTDGQTLTIGGLSLTNGQFLLITCDPTAADGYTVLLNGAGSPLAFTGVFPPVEPALTTWGIQAVAATQPTIQAQWQWTPRFLS